MGTNDPTRENTMSDAPANPDATATPATDEAMQALQATVTDLGLTPEQIKGRLEASRKWEDRAKANAKAAKDLEEVRRQSMTEQEQAVAEAVAAARAATLAEVGAELVDAEVTAAAAKLTAGGRTVDADALLEGIDRARFLGEDGKPDSAAIATWLDRVAPKAAEQPKEQQPAPAFPDLGQGNRGGGQSNMALNGDPLLRDLKTKLGIN